MNNISIIPCLVGLVYFSVGLIYKFKIGININIENQTNLVLLSLGNTWQVDSYITFGETKDKPYLCEFL
jgi:hypothetical protein